MSDERHDQDLRRDSQQPDAQDKTTTERIEKQDVTEETTSRDPVTPNKTADVRPNR